MIYTSGIIGDVDKKETLEELQDNKLATVCHKLQLKPEDRLLDIGCGWGTLVTYAAKNFGCDATGVTLSHNQAEFGNNRIAKNGVDPSRARILRTDFRNLDKQQKFTKIVTLEMAEVRPRVAQCRALSCIRRYSRPSICARSTSASAATTPSSRTSTTSSTMTASSSTRSPVSALPGSTRTSSGA